MTAIDSLDSAAVSLNSALVDIANAKALIIPAPMPLPPPPSISTYSQMVAALVNPATNSRTTPNKTLINPNLIAVSNAINALQPGDWLHCVGASISGQLNITVALSAYATVTFDGTSRFMGTVAGPSPSAAIYLYHAVYLNLIFEPGCTITNPGGRGILIHGGTHHCSLDGWYTYDTGSDGASYFPVEAEIHHIFSRGESKNIGLNHAYDPHADKGSGLHGMNVQDDNNFSFHDSIIAFYGHDFRFSGGSIIEAGVNGGGAQPYNNHYYIKGDRNLFQASTQTGGNGIIVYGGTQHDNTFHIAEFDDMMGKGVETDAESGTCINVVVEQGVATNCCQLPKFAGLNPWDRKGGIIYKNVTPVAA